MNELKTQTIPEVDYSKIDAMIEEITAKAISYMRNVPPETIRNAITKAYIFAKEAHH